MTNKPENPCEIISSFIEHYVPVRVYVNRSNSRFKYFAILYEFNHDKLTGNYGLIGLYENGRTYVMGIYGSISLIDDYLIDLFNVEPEEFKSEVTFMTDKHYYDVHVYFGFNIGGYSICACSNVELTDEEIVTKLSKVNAFRHEHDGDNVDYVEEIAEKQSLEWFNSFVEI